jgi:PII-like signaling protein
MVRIYLTEAEAQLKPLLKLLHEDQVKGVTAFRGIAGFGASGKLHSSTLVDLSLDLPVVVEFFDTPEKVEKILQHLSADIKPGHMVHWAAEMNA